MEVCWACSANGNHRNHPLLSVFYLLLGEFKDIFKKLKLTEHGGDVLYINQQ